MTTQTAINRRSVIFLRLSATGYTSLPQGDDESSPLLETIEGSDHLVRVRETNNDISRSSSPAACMGRTGARSNDIRDTTRSRTRQQQDTPQHQRRRDILLVDVHPSILQALHTCVQSARCLANLPVTVGNLGIDFLAWSNHAHAHLVSVQTSHLLSIAALLTDHLLCYCQRNIVWCPWKLPMLVQQFSTLSPTVVLLPILISITSLTLFLSLLIVGRQNSNLHATTHATRSSQAAVFSGLIALMVVECLMVPAFVAVSAALSSPSTQ
jgi:hypothetical protein